jgi:hypothetical protein
MKSNKNLFLSLILTLVLTSPKTLQAAFSNTPTAEFLLIGQGARASAMGDSIVANCFDYSALYWNPSAAAFLKRPELGFSNKTLYADIKNNYFSFIYPYKKFGFGIQFLGISADVDGYGKGGIPLPKYTVTNSASHIVCSYRFTDNLSAGMALGSVQMAISEGPRTTTPIAPPLTPNANALNINFSGMYKLNRFSAGVALANLGGNLSFDNKTNEYQPALMRLGASYYLSESRKLNLAGSLEKVFEEDNASGIGLGIEWWPIKYIALRFGIKSPANKKSISGVSLGLGLRYEQFDFDYSLRGGNVPEMGNLLDVNTISIAMRFGKTEGAAKTAAAPEVKEQPTVPSTPESVAAPPVPSGKGMNLAVADLQAKNVSAADASIVGDFLRTELVNNGTYNVIEKANMDRILTEVAFQQSGCTTSECAVQMGKLLNVQRMVVGSLSKLMDTYYITVNLVDVETGKILKSFDQDAMSAKELKNACGILAQKLSK